MDDTSLTLLDRLRETADSKSWERLVGLYAPLLKRWLRKYEVQESDADDIVQEVLTVVLNELPKFDHNQRIGAFRSWLRTILANRVSEFWRKRRYQPVATGTSSLDEKIRQLQDDASQVSQLWNREHDEYVLKRVLKMIRSQFESKTWHAFHRQVIEGQKSEVVAHELDMSVSAVYMAKSRVLSALRRQSAGLIDEL